MAGECKKGERGQKILDKRLHTIVQKIQSKQIIKNKKTEKQQAIENTLE